MNKKLILTRMRHNKFFVLGFIVGVAVLLIIILGPLFTTYDSQASSLAERLQPPSAAHIFGTDQLGRDIFTRLIEGGRYSLLIAFISVFLQMLIGTVLGLLAGYIGGVLDSIIMRACDVVLAIPNLILAIAVMAVLGPSTFNLILVLTVSGWVRECKVTRNNVMVIKKLEFVHASRVLGANNLSIMFKQIFPNCTTPLLVMASGRIGSVILAEAALSFLNMGIPAPTPSWGNMISDGRQYLSTCPWMVFAPGVALMLTILAFNFLGDGLRDVLDPKRI